ncbi:hypothetical protein [Zobellia roscoffensis]|uniref:hypothetical protein n=1 Tax=Zobellia roscoffensis TaxID=2779508 RepID=UPI00188D8F4F|nr:hypothetical protein [Zobellia roscoffensis]
MKQVPKNQRKVKTRFVVESIVVFFIVASPFIFKLHEYFPRDPEATINIFGYIIDRNGFANLNTYVWFLLGKAVPLTLLFIWFLTCKHWWYHIILIPLLMYAFQIFEVFYTDDLYIDTRNVLWLLPVCMVVIPLVYFIRIKLYDKYVHGIDLEAMEAELTALKKKQAARSGNTKLDKFISSETPKNSSTGYQSMSEKINTQLSTNNIESNFKQVQSKLNNWLHLKF